MAMLRHALRGLAAFAFIAISGAVPGWAADDYRWVQYGPDGVEARAMVAAADQFSDQWAAKGSGAVIDVAEEMTHLTLKVISETMFSSDGDMLGQLIDRSLSKMTDAIDFSVADILPIIGPPRMKKKMDRIHQNFVEMDATMKKLIAARQKVQVAAPRDLLDRLKPARIGSVFPTLRRNQPYTESGFKSMWNKLVKKALAAGIIERRFTFHDLRAYYATQHKIQRGALPDLHANPATTARVYDRSKESKRGAL